jgi:putative membrane protein
VYHATKEVGSDSSETFKIMERRLIKFIIDPAAISSWVFGLALVYSIGVENLGQAWLQIKILLVLALSGLHGYFAKLVKDFEADKRTKNHKFYRIINELPTALFIIIVFLVIFKPN